jgi:hypothetical protein
MATWAKGVDFKNSNNTSRIGGIGIYGTDSTINKLYIGLGTEPWNNAGLQLTSSAINFKGNKIYHAGDKPTASEIGAAASSHTHNYMPHTKYTTTQDADNIKTTGVYSFNATCTNAATSNHGTLITEFNVGTPYQLWMPDNANIIYKRNYTTSSGTWGSWNNTLANNISGNASTATTLQTARTLTIGNTGKSFNGSGNISWSLSEIGAAASSHSHNSLTTKGTNTINSTANDTTANWGAHGHSVHWYTQSGCLNGQPSQYGYILNLGSGTEVHQLWMTQASGNLAHRGGNGSGWNGSWKTILDSSNFTSYAASANHSHSNYAASSHTHNMISMKSSHVSDWTSSSAMNGKTYMGGWHGNLTSGTAGYISLGANGSSTLDLFIDGEVYVKENQKVYHPGNKPTAADIGAAASNHTHSYLPLSGGTMTGTLALKPGGSTLTGTGIATGNTQLIGTGTDTIYFGNPKTKIILESNSTPSVSVNGTIYTMYHTGNKPTASEIGAAAASHTHNYAAASHTHGLLHDTMIVEIPSTTTDNGWSMLNSSYNGFLLKSIRTNAKAPSWILGDYSAGIVFGGADTKGVLSMGYSSPTIKFAGGNGTKPVWNMALTGSSGKTYNMESLSANTATKLATARTINGTSFNGSANITTANWGTARTITIGNTGKSVNGSGNISWSLSEIGAAASSHTHSYLPLSGGTLSGSLSLNTSNAQITFKGYTDSSYYQLAHSSVNNVLFFGYNGVTKLGIHNDGSFIPVGNKLMNLGDNNNKFKTLYTDEIINDSAKLLSSKTTNTLEVRGTADNNTGAIKLGGGGCRIYGTGSATKMYVEGGIYTNKMIECGEGIVANGAVYPGKNAQGGWDCGLGDRRFYTVYCVNVNQSSDRNMKEDIHYIDNEIALLSTESENPTPFKDFICNDLKVATYKYKRQITIENEDGTSEVEDIEHEPQDSQIGFIAQDIRDTEIGSMFVYGEDGNMNYSPSGFTTVVAKALQEEIKTRDLEIEALKNRLKILEEKLGLQ